jgi:hypothetical protein
MAISIPAAVKQIKATVAQWLRPEAIHQLCSDLGHRWRNRLLNPATTIQLFALQILHGNTACDHVPRLAHLDCTGVAYGQARSRLPLALFQHLLRLVTTNLPVSTAGEGRWHGHRTFLIDGSNLSMPDTPELQQTYGQPSGQAPGCGFPQMHLMAMFQASTGFLMSVDSAPYRTQDMTRATAMHPALEAGDVLVGDRGLSSFVHLAILQKQGVFGLFRTHQAQIVNFRPGRPHVTGSTWKASRKGWPTSIWIRRLGFNDQLVDYTKPKTCPSWMTAAEYAELPATIRVREVRYRIRIPGQRTKEVTLTTTLLDPMKYPAKELAKLYAQRWEIETNFAHLKTTMKMEVLRCKTVDGVEKELLMSALVYNLIRLVMLEASRRQRVRVQRISFADAARWLAQAMKCGANPPLKLRVNPHRPNRAEPRVKKRRPKKYDWMTKPRRQLKEELLTMGHAT